MFSVVVPTHDHAATVGRAIDAVLAQTARPAQVIVVDDGSVDDTPARLAAFGPAIEVVRTDGVGVSAARNAGVARAGAPWVVFLDDDDVPAVEWLSTLAELVDDDVAIASCGVRIRRPGGGESIRSPITNPESNGGRVLLLAGAFAVRRALLVEVGGYLDGLTFSENTELGLRLLPAATAAGLRLAATDAAPLVVHQADERRSARGRHDALLQVLAAHEDRFAAQPGRYARWLNVAAVDAWRADDRSTARTLLRRAVRVQPTKPKSWVRLAAASVPPLGDRLWADRGATARRAS